MVADEKRLRHILRHGEDDPLLLGVRQKFARPFGLGGVVEIEDPDDLLFRHHDILTDMQIAHQSTSPFRI